MTHILRRLPFSDHPLAVQVAEQTIAIRPFQIVLWVGLGAEENSPSGRPPFPAVLDTGHNHNFSIQQTQLSEWTGLSLKDLHRNGGILVNRREVPLFSADVWLHRNRPDTAELLPAPWRLSLREGIAVYPKDMPNSPRLPLLGLRALVANDLRLTIMSKRRVVSLQRELD